MTDNAVTAIVDQAVTMLTHRSRGISKGRVGNSGCGEKV